MLTIAAIPITCWLCALIAMPRKPLFGNEIQELVYSRLLSRQRWLALFALVVTAGAFLIAILMLPQQFDPALRAARDPHRVCTYPPIGFPTCYQLQPGGAWTHEEVMDGSWVVVDIVAAPLGINPYDDPASSTRSR